MTTTRPCQAGHRRSSSYKASDAPYHESRMSTGYAWDIRSGERFEIKKGRLGIDLVSGGEVVRRTDPPILPVRYIPLPARNGCVLVKYNATTVFYTNKQGLRALSVYHFPNLSTALLPVEAASMLIEATWSQNSRLSEEPEWFSAQRPLTDYDLYIDADSHEDSASVKNKLDTETSIQSKIVSPSKLLLQSESDILSVYTVLREEIFRGDRSPNSWRLIFAGIEAPPIYRNVEKTYDDWLGAAAMWRNQPDVEGAKELIGVFCSIDEAAVNEDDIDTIIDATVDQFYVALRPDSYVFRHELEMGGFTAPLVSRLQYLRTSANIREMPMHRIYHILANTSYRIPVKEVNHPSRRLVMAAANAAEAAAVAGAQLAQLQSKRSVARATAAPRPPPHPKSISPAERDALKMHNLRLSAGALPAPRPCQKQTYLIDQVIVDSSDAHRTRHRKRFGDRANVAVHLKLNEASALVMSEEVARAWDTAPAHPEGGKVVTVAQFNVLSRHRITLLEGPDAEKATHHKIPIMPPWEQAITIDFDGKTVQGDDPLLSIAYDTRHQSGTSFTITPTNDLFVIQFMEMGLIVENVQEPNCIVRVQDDIAPSAAELATSLLTSGQLGRWYVSVYLKHENQSASAAGEQTQNNFTTCTVLRYDDIIKALRDVDAEAQVAVSASDRNRVAVYTKMPSAKLCEILKKYVSDFDEQNPVGVYRKHARDPKQTNPVVEAAPKTVTQEQLARARTAVDAFCQLQIDPSGKELADVLSTIVTEQASFYVLDFEKTYVDEGLVNSFIKKIKTLKKYYLPMYKGIQWKLNEWEANNLPNDYVLIKDADDI